MHKAKNSTVIPVGKPNKNPTSLGRCNLHPWKQWYGSCHTLKQSSGSVHCTQNSSDAIPFKVNTLKSKQMKEWTCSLVKDKKDHPKMLLFKVIILVNSAYIKLNIS